MEVAAPFVAHGTVCFDMTKDFRAEEAQLVMQQLRKFPVFFARSLAQTFGEVFIPCPKVSCDDEAIESSLGQDIRSDLRTDTIGNHLVVECHGLLVVVVDAIYVTTRHTRKCTAPAALHGEGEVAMPRQLQEDGEAARHMEAGTGVLQDRKMPCLEDVLYGGVGRLFLVALADGGLDNAQRLRCAGDEVDVRHGTSRPFRGGCRQ